MKNYRTTLFGLILAAIVAIEPIVKTGVFEWHQLIMPALIAAIGYVAKDAKVSGN